MAENNSLSKPKTSSSKKMLENPFVGSLVVPIAIVLVGALIIFGVTKMLSSERSYRDLAQDLQSKTFGNKWIAAYELSKKIVTSQIPEEEKPYIIKVLSETYYGSKEDPRTRDFVIVALGALKSELGLSTIYSGLQDADSNVVYRSVVSLANMPKEMIIDWEKIAPFLKNDDPGLRQVTVLALSTHNVQSQLDNILALLSDSNLLVRYSAATGLINFKHDAAIPILLEILSLKEPESATKLNLQGLDSKQIASLKIGALDALLRAGWVALNADMEKFAEVERNQQVALRMKEVLNKLKN